MGTTLDQYLAIMADLKKSKGYATIMPHGLSQTTPNLETLLGIYPIRRHLMQYLDTRDLLKLYQTSWTICQDIKTNDWNINDRLSHFFKNPMAFRSHLGRANALISGSFALQFFERVTWPESDVNIMIKDGDCLGEMNRYLTESEEYTMVHGPPSTSEIDQGDEDDDGNAYAGYQVKETYMLHRKDPNSDKVTTRKVQLVVTRGPPAQVILCNYYTTVVVNFISWNKAYSIFPRATFLFHETVPLKPVDDRYGRLYAKYSRRGWRMRTEPVVSTGEAHQQPWAGHQLPLGELGKRGSRRIGDRDSWIMRLGDTAGVEGSSNFVPDFVLEYSCFQLDNLPKQGQDLDRMTSWSSASEVLCVPIRASIWRSQVLRYEYLVNYHKFWSKLNTMTALNMIGQLCKFSSSRLNELFGGRSPSQLNHYQLNANSFDHPEGWDYMDDVISRMYDWMESEGQL